MSNQITTIKEYLRRDDIVQSFRDVVGDNNASAYISSVLIAVSGSTALLECEPISILNSAMRAATLRLSCDPSTGEAYLVPYGNKATLIIGYKGIRQMALRTGQYRYLNVSKIFEGEVITEDRMTGMHSLTGGKTSDVVIGYLLYFELMTGFRKSFYMTVEEIAEHARKYSRSLDKKDSPWKTARSQMERKTVLRLGLGLWGYFDPHDTMMLHKIEDSADDDTIESEFTEIEQMPESEQHEPMGEQQIMTELGF